MKTAGSSLEQALEPDCGDSDIVTLPGSRRNLFVAYRYYRLLDLKRIRKYRKLSRFWPHSGASFIKQRIPRKIWNHYFKFCFERNPYDRYISSFYFRKSKNPELTLDLFFKEKSRVRAHSEMYCIGNKVAVDKIYKYEELDSALIDIARQCGIPKIDNFERFQGKTGLRKDHRVYHEVLTPKQIHFINVKERKTFELMGYKMHS